MNLIGAERAAGLVFREDFRSRYLAESNGCALLGDAYVDTDGLGNTATGYASVEVPSVSVGAFTVVVRFTPSGVWNTGTVRYLLDTESGNRTFRIAVDAANQLFVEVNGTTVFTVAGGVGTWSDGWVAGQETVLVCAISSGDSYVAVGGNSHTSVTTFAVSAQIRKLFLLATNAGATVLVGSVREFVLIGHRVEALDEPVLRNNTLISDIRSDQSLITLPLERDYPVSGVQSTPLEGTHKAVLDHARLGDGVTASTFPTRLLHRERGYSFDGGDYIYVADHDDLSFVDGSNDLPFTLAVSVDFTSLASTAMLLAKGGHTATQGEYRFYATSTRNVTLLVIDETSAAYIGAVALGALSVEEADSGVMFVTLVTTYDGSKSTSGVSLYKDGVALAVTPLSSGVYSQIRNTSRPVTFMSSSLPGTFASAHLDNASIYSGALSPIQVKALTHQMSQEAGL